MSDEPAKKQKKPLLLAGSVTVLMLVEALAVGGAFWFLAPRGAEAVELDNAGDEGMEFTDLELLKATFPNSGSGRLWRWDIEVHIRVKNEDLVYVQEQIESRDAEIREQIGMIVRSSEERHLNEPTMATLRRRIEAALNEIFEPNDGEPRVEAVMIPALTPAPGDF